MKRSTLIVSLALALTVALEPGFARAGAPATVEPDVVYGHKDGLAMTMDVYRPQRARNRAAILFVVSGGWFSRWSPPERLMPLFQPYLDEGYTVFAIRHGSSPRYSIPEAVSDLRQAVRFLRHEAERFEIDAHRLGAMGMSAGGHLALMLGTTGDDGDPEANDELGQCSSRVAAVVALVPPTDLSVMVWDSPESLPAYRQFPALELSVEKAKQNSPLLEVTADDAPALVFMGERDELVPAKHGRWIDEAFLRENVPRKVVIFPDAGHGLEGDETRATVVRETIDWFDQHLVNQTE
jgi:acetyl esterase/lipase